MRLLRALVIALMLISSILPTPVKVQVSAKQKVKARRKVIVRCCGLRSCHPTLRNVHKPYMPTSSPIGIGTTSNVVTAIFPFYNFANNWITGRPFWITPTTYATPYETVFFKWRRHTDISTKKSSLTLPSNKRTELTTVVSVTDKYDEEYYEDRDTTTLNSSTLKPTLKSTSTTLKPQKTTTKKLKKETIKTTAKTTSKKATSKKVTTKGKHKNTKVTEKMNTTKIELSVKTVKMTRAKTTQGSSASNNIPSSPTTSYLTLAPLTSVMMSTLELKTTTAFSKEITDFTQTVLLTSSSLDVTTSNSLKSDVLTDIVTTVCTPICKSVTCEIDKTWSQAQIQCCKFGMSLVSMEHNEEGACLAELHKKHIGFENEFWTSATNNGCEHQWHWCSVNESLAKDVNWQKGKPFNAAKNRCASVLLNVDSPPLGLLGDSHCNEGLKYACEGDERGGNSNMDFGAIQNMLG